MALYFRRRARAHRDSRAPARDGGPERRATRDARDARDARVGSAPGPSTLRVVAGAALRVLEGALTAALLAEQRRRRQAQAVSDEQTHFQLLLSELTAIVARAPAAGLDRAIEEVLARLVAEVGVDRAGLAELESEHGVLHLTHWWASERHAVPATRFGTNELPYVVGRLLRGELVHLSGLDDLPPQATVDRATLVRRGVRAFVALPTAVDGNVVVLVLAMLRRPRRWPDALLARLRLLADVLATAVVRRRAEEEIGDREALNTAMLESLSARVAVLDHAGVVVRANHAWRSSARPAAGDAADHGRALVLCDGRGGASVLDCLRRSVARGSSVASDALFGIESVLSGAHEEFTMEYGDAGDASERYFELTAEALRRSAGGAVLTIRDVTSRKHAEAEARRRAEEVAHLSRVAAVSGLATSIAHELKQPLTAIRANCNAALRLLATDPPDLATVREIAQDVSDAVLRAAGVIDGMRALLKRGGATTLAPVDVNDVVHAVVRLVATDAAVRRVQLALELRAGLPPVLGDAVQLQQVLLNLVLNALEAMEGSKADERIVTVTTAAPAPSSVEITVSDTGPGLPEGNVFESFFTTKPSGLGMGLPVARLIVEAHGGRVWAESAPSGGATFRVVLPAATAAALPVPPARAVALA